MLMEKEELVERRRMDGRLELRKAFSRRWPRLGSLALRTPPTAVSATRRVLEYTLLYSYVVMD